MPEHAAPGQFVERHRGGRDLVQMGEIYVRNLRQRYQALVKVSEDLEATNNALAGYRERRPAIPTSMFDGMVVGLVYSELWALVGTIRRQLSLLQAYVTFGRFLPTEGLAKDFNEAMATTEGRELFLQPMAIADTHFMGCWLADAPSSYAYFLATLRVPCYVFHRCLPGDLPAGACTFDGGRNYLKVAKVDDYVYAQPEVVNLGENNFLRLEDLPDLFYGVRRVVRAEETGRTSGSVKGQEAKLVVFEKDYSSIKEVVPPIATKYIPPARIPRPPPRSAARPLDAVLYQPTTVSLDPRRVDWCVPPPIAPMPEGKFAYYVEVDPPVPTKFITVRNASQAAYQRIVEERGAYTIFCRYSRRAFRLYSTINYPTGCLLIDDFGFAVPEGTMRITSVMGGVARMEASPTWVYPYSPRAGTIGRRMKTPAVEALPLRVVGDTMPFEAATNLDDEEDYWEYGTCSLPSNVEETVKEPQAGQLKAPVLGKPLNDDLNDGGRVEDATIPRPHPLPVVDQEEPAGQEAEASDQALPIPDTVGAQSAPEGSLRPGSVLSWLKFWPGPDGWERGTLDLDEVVEGLHSFVQRKQGVFSTRAMLVAEAGDFAQVYLQVDRPQEHAIIRGLLRHRPWPTLPNSRIEVEDISKEDWDLSWDTAQAQDKMAITLVFKAPTFASFCSLLKTHEQRTGQELDLADLPLSREHLEMLGWPTKNKPMSWKEAPGAGHMPVDWVPSQLIEEGYFLKHYNGRAHARGLRGGPRARRARDYYEEPEEDEPRKVAKLHERMGVHIPTPAPLQERLQQGAPTLEERLSGSRSTLQERLSGSSEAEGMDMS